MGLIDSMQQPQEAVNENEAAGTNENTRIEELNKVVMAAQNVMYNQSTHQMMLEQIEKTGGGPAKKAGTTAAYVMSIVKKFSGKDIDPNVLVSAGIIVVSDVLDFISKTTGEKFQENDEFAACEVYLGMMQTMFGGANE